MRTILRKLVALVALGLLLAPWHPLGAAEVGPATTATAAESATGSIPIVLPDAPALPAKDELVGGFIVEFVVAVILIFLIVGLVIVICELTHHHVFVHDCEECRHHAPPPPPAPPPGPGPAQPEPGPSR